MTIQGTKTCSYVIIVSQLNLQALEISLVSIRLKETLVLVNTFLT